MQESTEFEAYNEGLQAYLRGLPQRSCPYADTSVRHAIWCAGWMDGLRLTDSPVMHMTDVGTRIA